jgi:3-methyladenine DNA glycosylase/8-oxoguanine DNA glycosylase
MLPDADRTLPVEGPLNLRATLEPMRRGPGDPTVRFDDDAIWRAARTPEGPVSLRLAPEGMGVHASAWGEGAGWMVERVADLLGLHDDDAGFRPDSPLLKELYRRFRGMRFGRTGQVMEALVPTILSQRVTGPNAGRSWKEVVWTWGERAPGPRKMWVTPDPRRLAALAPWELIRCGVEARRGEVVVRACRVARRMEEAAGMTTEAAAERLMAVRGVGPWTAAKVIRVVLGDPDVVPTGDYHLPHTVAWALADEPRGTDERMLELLEPYRPHRGRVVRLLGLAEIHAPKYGPRRGVVDIRER